MRSTPIHPKPTETRSYTHTHTHTKNGKGLQFYFQQTLAFNSKSDQCVWKTVHSPACISRGELTTAYNYITEN